MTELGRRVYGWAAILLGLVGLWWRDFASIWQPVPQGMAGRTLFAVLAALLLLAAGSAMQWRKTVRPGSIMLAVLYLIFALLWSARIVQSPKVFVNYSGTAEQLALVLGAIVALASVEAAPSGSKIVRDCRLVFGFCLLLFGMAHFAYPSETAAMVPASLPPSPRFWGAATGMAHIVGGIALLLGMYALLAARLVTAMFVVFGLFVWLPQLFSSPASHMVWAGNALNLALVGAIWVLADAMSTSCGTRGDSRSPSCRRKKSSK